MELRKDVVVLEVFGGLACELLDVGAGAEGLGDVAEEDDNFDIWGGLVLLDCLRDVRAHLCSEGIEVFGTVEVDEADFVFGLDVHLVEGETDLQATNYASNRPHIL